MTNTSRILRVMDTMGLLTACLPAYWENAVQFERQLLIADALGALESVISRSRDDNTASKLLLGVMVVALDQFRNELGEFLSHQFSDRNTAVLMMMLLLTPPQLTPEAWVSFFRLSRAEGKFLTALSRAWKYSMPLSGELNDRHLHKYFREFGEAGIGGILLHLAEQLARQTLETQPELWGDFLEYRTVPFLDAYFRKYQSVIAPHPLITGDDLQKAMGVKQGRIMGEILEAILEAQAAGELKTKKQALQYARQMLRKSPVEMGGN